MEQVYSALSGDEVRQAVLQEVDKYLRDDHRFKKAIAYHRLSWKWNLSFKAFQQPTQDVTVAGEVLAKKLEDKVRALEEQLAAKQTEFTRALDQAVQERHHETASLQLQIRDWEDKYNGLASLLDSKTNPTPAATQPAAEPAAAEDGSVEFFIESVKPEIEAPERLRESLASGLDEVVGRSPQEANIPGTNGEPSTSGVGRGAVVGGGKRPGNVVGRPR